LEGEINSSLQRACERSGVKKSGVLPRVLYPNTHGNGFFFATDAQSEGEHTRDALSMGDEPQDIQMTGNTPQGVHPTSALRSSPVQFFSLFGM
jgi:hypothetical protein